MQVQVEVEVAEEVEVEVEVVVEEATKISREQVARQQRMSTQYRPCTMRTSRPALGYRHSCAAAPRHPPQLSRSSCLLLPLHFHTSTKQLVKAKATAAAGPPLLSCSTLATCAGTPQAHQSCQEQARLARSALDPYTPRSTLSSLYLPMILSTYQRSLWENGRVLAWCLAQWTGCTTRRCLSHAPLAVASTTCRISTTCFASTPTRPRSAVPSRQHEEQRIGTDRLQVSSAACKQLHVSQQCNLPTVSCCTAAATGGYKAASS